MLLHNIGRRRRSLGETTKICSGLLVDLSGHFFLPATQPRIAAEAHGGGKEADVILAKDANHKSAFVLIALAIIQRELDHYSLY